MEELAGAAWPQIAEVQAGQVAQPLAAPAIDLNAFRTAEEWTALRDALPCLGLVSTARRNRERMKREDWPKRRVSIGGAQAQRQWQIEYALPPALRLRAKYFLERRASASGREIGVRFEMLPEHGQHRADARYEILRALDEWIDECPDRPRDEAATEFCDAYNARAIQLSESTRALVAKISLPTLTRWARDFRRGGMAALAGKYGNRKHQTLIKVSPAMAEVAWAMLYHNRRVSARSVLTAIRVKCPGLDAYPSIRTVQRHISEIKRERKAELMLHTAPDKWRNSYQVSIAKPSREITRINQLWLIDATPLEVETTEGRWDALTIIDVFTRRFISYLVPNVNAQAAIDLVGAATCAWGWAEKLKGDNGSEFKNLHFERVLKDLGINQDFSRPYRPRDKAIVERAQGTLVHDFCPWLMGRGYLGPDVAVRKEIESKKTFASRMGLPGEKRFGKPLTPPELQKLINQYALYEYGERTHSSLGMAPNELARRHADEVVWLTEDQKEALRRVLGAVPDNDGVRMVRQAGVAVDGANFWLSGFEAMGGHRVRVFYTADAGILDVYSIDPVRYLGQAVNLERKGFDLATAGIAAAAAQKRWIVEQRALTRRVKQKIKAPAIIEAHLKALATQHGAGVAEMTRTAVEAMHTTAALEAGHQAALPPPSIQHDPEVIAEGERVIQGLTQPKLEWPDNDELFARYERFKSDRPLTERDTFFLDRVGQTVEDWAASYEATPECISYQKLRACAA